MNNLKRASALASLLAVGVALAAGCTTSTLDTEPDPDSGVAGAGGLPATGGAGGSAGGSAGEAGSAGADGGTAGSAGAAGDGGFVGGECLGDEAVADVKPSCDDLPYATDDCGSLAPLGKDVCDHLAANGRDGVFERLFSCLMAIDPPEGSCSDAHDDAAMFGDNSCVNDNFGLVCDADNVALGDGGSFGCNDIVTACPEGGTAPGITTDECEGTLFAYNDQGRTDIIDCTLNGTGTADCEEDFLNCAFPFLSAEPACLGSDTIDPGFSGVCANHPFAAQDCGGNTPLFLDICQRVEAAGRGGTFENLFNCYSSNITDATAACDESASGATFTCFDAAFDRSCVWSSLESRCATLAGNTCSDSSDQISADDCDLTLAGFTLATAETILTCAEGGTSPGCASELEACAFP